jgi:hypothetical protein
VDALLYHLTFARPEAVVDQFYEKTGSRGDLGARSTPCWRCSGNRRTASAIERHTTAPKLTGRNGAYQCRAPASRRRRKNAICFRNTSGRSSPRRRCTRRSRSRARWAGRDNLRVAGTRGTRHTRVLGWTAEQTGRTAAQRDLLSKFRTVVACHRPPRAVRIPRLLSASAIPR